MSIYFGETVTAQAEGQTWRAEQCEHCGQQFYYLVRFVATGTAHNPYFLDASSSNRAEADANNALDCALRQQVVPVPCPHCTLYQGYMVPAVRDDQFPRMRIAGRVFLSLTPVALFIGCGIFGAVSNAAGPDADKAVGFAVAFGLPALFLSAGIGLLLVRHRRQALYDPNAAEYAVGRRRLATGVALKPEEFAKLRVPPPSLVSSRPQGQLVNQNCVRCGQRISNEIDSRFCTRCGLPVHNHCAVPTEGGCPMCGAGGSPTS